MSYPPQMQESIQFNPVGDGGEIVPQLSTFFHDIGQDIDVPFEKWFTAIQLDALGRLVVNILALLYLC